MIDWFDDVFIYWYNRFFPSNIDSDGLKIKERGYGMTFLNFWVGGLMILWKTLRGRLFLGFIDKFLEHFGKSCFIPPTLPYPLCAFLLWRIDTHFSNNSCTRKQVCHSKKCRSSFVDLPSNSFNFLHMMHK